MMFPGQRTPTRVTKPVLALCPTGCGHKFYSSILEEKLDCDYIRSDPTVHNHSCVGHSGQTSETYIFHILKMVRT